MTSEWMILGIAPTNDIREVKKAYANKLKVYHPEEQPDKFQELRLAYEAIKKAIKQGELNQNQADDPDTMDDTWDEQEDNDSLTYEYNSYDYFDDEGMPEDIESKKLANEFMDEVYSIYHNYDKRINLKIWQDLFEVDKYWGVDTKVIINYRMMNLLLGDVQFPFEIWKYFKQQLTFLNQFEFRNNYSNDARNCMTALTNIKLELSYDKVEIKNDCYDVGSYIQHRDNVFFSLANDNMEDAKYHLEKAQSINSKDEDIKRLSIIFHVRNCGSEKAYELYNVNNSATYQKEVFDYLEECMNTYSKITRLLEPDDIMRFVILNRLLIILKTREFHGDCLIQLIESNSSSIVNNLLISENFANTLQAAELYEEALEIYDRIREREPENLSVLNEQAYTLFQLNRYQEALDYYDIMLSLDSYDTDESFWSNRGRVFQKLKQSKDAIKCFDKSIAINKMNSFTWRSKGLTYYEDGNNTKAMICYNKALDINPADAEAWNLKAYILKKRKKYSDALDCFDKAIEYNNCNSKYWSNKGKLLQTLKQYERAIESCNMAIDLDPSNDWGWYIKGCSLKELKRYEEALDCINEAISLDRNESLYVMQKTMIELSRDYL